MSAVAPGLALALAVAAAATLVGRHVPLIGSAVPGAVIGAAIAVVVRPGARLAPGLKYASTFLLQCSVVLLGAQLSIGEAARVGLSSLPVMLGTLAVCLGAAWLYGRLLGVPQDLRTLVGVGTGICGGSAIAAVSPVIEAASTDVAYAISTIFLFNITAVFVFPLLGHALGMSQQSFGLFAGTAVNDTSSVVATAATYGAAATSHAVVVKLVRTLMIIPICLGLATLTARRRRVAPEPQASPALAALAAPAAPCTVVPASAGQTVHGQLSGTQPGRPGAATPASAAAAAPESPARRMSPARVLRLVPWFLIGFVLVAAVNSTGIVPAAAHGSLQQASVFLVAVALSAIGLSTDVAALRRAGHKPLLLGALLWATVAAASLGLQALTGTM
ncbi:MAG TPA: putative sulfate exporter family transporter [Trebonia sp.]|nr:putative sulfate exporter family transporter [Trebonia sp.]